MSIVVTEEVTTRRRSPAPTTAPPRAARRPRNWLTILALLAPASIALLALVIVPVGKMVTLSFQKPNIFRHTRTWVGFANYRMILRDHEFWTVVVKSVVFAVVSAGATIVVGLAVAAAMMHMHRALRLAVSSALVLVWATPQFIGATIWRWFFDTEFGLVNYLMFSLGLIDNQTHSWVTSQWTSFTIVFIVVVWQAVPFVALAIYGALLTVPSDLHEAAQMDGAGVVTLFRRVTLPLIVPVLVISSLLSVIWDFRVLTQIAFTTQGQPYGQTNLLGPYIVQKTIAGGEFGVASAIGVIVTCLLMGLAFVYVRILRKEDA